jgi:hypothetical protein
MVIPYLGSRIRIQVLSCLQGWCMGTEPSHDLDSARNRKDAQVEYPAVIYQNATTT